MEPVFAAVRAWHGEQPGGHHSTREQVRVIDTPGGPALVALHAAWWCDCGEPRYGGIAISAPLPSTLVAFGAARAGAVGAWQSAELGI